MTAGSRDEQHRSVIARLEIVAAVLLALATVATAWSSYQATRWNGEQAKAAARANALRIESATKAGRANILSSVDVTTFTQWVNAHAADDGSLEDFYRSRFRAEFKPAFEAWLATNPFDNPDAPPLPFQMQEYVVADRAESDRLNTQSEIFAALAGQYIQRSSNYILCVVLFAAALFVAGLSTRFDQPWPRRVVLALGSVVLVLTLAWMLTFPISFVV